jgi:hypothetical protein
MDRCTACRGQIVWDDSLITEGPQAGLSMGYGCESCGKRVCAWCGRKDLAEGERYCDTCSGAEEPPLAI